MSGSGQGPPRPGLQQTGGSWSHWWHPLGTLSGVAPGPDQHPIAEVSAGNPWTDGEAKAHPERRAGRSSSAEAAPTHLSPRTPRARPPPFTDTPGPRPAPAYGTTRSVGRTCLSPPEPPVAIVPTAADDYQGCLSSLCSLHGSWAQLCECQAWAVPITGSAHRLPVLRSPLDTMEPPPGPKHSRGLPGAGIEHSLFLL